MPKQYPTPASTPRHSPAARPFANIHTARLRRSMERLLIKRDELAVASLEPGSVFDHDAMARVAQMAASMGVELILRRIAAAC